MGRVNIIPVSKATQGFTCLATLGVCLCRLRILQLSYLRTLQLSVHAGACHAPQVSFLDSQAVCCKVNNLADNLAFVNSAGIWYGDAMQIAAWCSRVTNIGIHKLLPQTRFYQLLVFRCMVMVLGT